MADSYIPASDAGALAWMQVFASTLSANAGLYGISTADATAISDAVAAYQQA